MNSFYYQTKAETNNRETCVLKGYNRIDTSIFDVYYGFFNKSHQEKEVDFSIVFKYVVKVVVINKIAFQKIQNKNLKIQFSYNQTKQVNLYKLISQYFTQNQQQFQKLRNINSLNEIFQLKQKLERQLEGQILSLPLQYWLSKQLKTIPFQIIKFSKKDKTFLDHYLLNAMKINNKDRLNLQNFIDITQNISQSHSKAQTQKQIHLIFNLDLLLKQKTLMKLSDFILLTSKKIKLDKCQLKIKDQNIDFIVENSILIRQIVKESYNYLAKTSKFYPQISLDNIYFDSISLKCKLHFCNPLLFHLGLLSQPKTPEAILSFLNTPFEINQKQQFIENNIEKYNISSSVELNHPHLFLIDILLDQPVEELEEEKEEGLKWKVQSNIQHLQRVQQSHIERLIQIMYVICNNKTYIQSVLNLKGITNKHIICRQLQNLNINLKNNIVDFTQFLPHRFGAKDPSYLPFSMKIQHLLNLVNRNKNDDSMIEQNRFFKIKRYCTVKIELSRRISRIFSNQNLWQKMYNAKKYLIIFYGFQDSYLEFLKIILETEIKTEGQQKKIFKEEVIGFHSNIIDNNNKQNNFTNKYLKKVKEYIKRDDRQAKYLQKKKSLLQEMEKFAQEIQAIRLQYLELVDLEGEVTKTNGFQKMKKRKEFVEQAQLLITKLNKTLSQIKKQFKKVFQQQIRKDIDNIALFHICNENYGRQDLVVLNRKMLIMLKISLKINISNYSSMENLQLNQINYIKIGESQEILDTHLRLNDNRVSLDLLKDIQQIVDNRSSFQ